MARNNIFLSYNICTYCRSDSSSNLPPKPPMRPRHTLQSIDAGVIDGNGDVFDGGIDARRGSLSPSYVDPTELNTKIPRGGSLE